VAQLVTPLEKQGFVERAVDPDDRRITLLRATGKGRAQMEGIRSQAVHGLAGFLNHLSDQELDALLRLELKIINGTEKILNKEEDSEHGHV
jgi:DNA-binding MarR family transcriptional regulator